MPISHFHGPCTYACTGGEDVLEIWGTFLSEYPILEARNQLAKYGWFPVDWESYLKTDAGKNSVKDDFYQNARLEYGLPEIETCSGTGVGYCSLIYQHDYAFLNVTTVGDIEGAQVLGFSSQCK